MRTLTLILLAVTLYGGDSLTLLNRHAYANLPVAPSKEAPWRVEMYAHDVDLMPAGALARLSAYGLDILTIGVNNVVDVTNYYWNSGEVGNCQLTPGAAFYLRIQRDPTAKTLTCEAWDTNGNRTQNRTVTYADNTPGPAGTEVFVGGWSAGPSVANIGFLRIHSTLVPLNSRSPVTYDPVDRLHEWKFDGTLNDEVGGVTLTSGGGSAVYTTTPFQNNVAVGKINPKSWSNITSIRAGHSFELNALSSFSQADGTNSVSCDWWQVSGPSKVVIEATNNCLTKAKGTVFGSYRFAVRVSSAGLPDDTKIIDVGSVATDEKGVVIHENPFVNDIFGPMIAFGRNPWEAVDEANMRALNVRGVEALAARYQNDWTTKKTGTVSFYGNWLHPSAYRATLSGPITTSSMTIPVTNLTNLNLVYPTAIQLGYNTEWVLISGNSGNDLIVAPNGRGFGGTTPISLGSGATIHQSVAFGSGTTFLSDYCRGKQGPAFGDTLYTTGTVSIEPGSNVLTGSGTNWILAPAANWNLFQGITVRFDGVIAGQPFVFAAKVVSRESETSITLDRPFPASANSLVGSTYEAYNNNLNWTPRFNRPDGSEGSAFYAGFACISDTQLIYQAGLELYGGTLNTGKEQTATTEYWSTQAGNGSPNFYDEMGANYATWLRSGLQKAADAARWLAERWSINPIVDQGWGFAAGIPRNMSAIGMLASWKIDGVKDELATFRRLAAQGQERASQLAGGTCYTGDLRENAYEMSWLAMAAKADTENAATWSAALDTVLVRDQACQTAGYYPGTYNNLRDPSITFTNNSREATGVDISEEVCQSLASGTGSIDNNSATLNGTGIPEPSGFHTISVSGMRDGVPFSWQGNWGGSGSSVTLSGLWAGTTGSVNWIVHTNEDHTIFLDSSTDSQANVANPCFWNSSTSITLGKPWQGSTGDRKWYRANLAGHGTQPFMAGIKLHQYRFAINATSGSTQTAFRNLAVDMANWIKNTGYDPRNKGLYYGRGFAGCEPPVDPPNWNPATLTSSPAFSNVVSGCQYGFGPSMVSIARALNAEAQLALTFSYEADPSVENRNWGDAFYSAQWGKAGLTAEGLPSDDGQPNIFADDSAFSLGKWYGFQFGVGMAHQWPAVRVGGVAAPDVRTVTMSIALPGGATAASVAYTAPSGASSTVTCSVAGGFAMCALPTDFRQGSYLHQVTITLAAGSVTGDRLPLGVQ